MFDMSALFRRSTEPQAAAFILPSCGRVPCCRWPRRRKCDNLRNSARKSQIAHYGLHSDDLDTNSCRFGALLVAGIVTTGPRKRGSPAVRSPFCSSAVVLFGFINLVGNNALEQLRVRSSGLHVRVLRAALAGGTHVGGDVTCVEIRVLRQIKVRRVFLLDVARIASAKPTSGRSQERRPVAIAQ